MKCLQVAGDEGLVRDFIAGSQSFLGDRTVFVVGPSPDGGFSIRCPGELTVSYLLHSMPPDLAVVTGPPLLAAPVVWCGQDPPGDILPLLISTYRGDGNSLDYEDIIEKVFDLLPQRSGEECGRCGTDCRGLAEAVIAGERKPEDCFYSGRAVEMTQDGRKLELGNFPARVLEGTLRGLLSTLKGYREGSDIGIVLRGDS